MDAKTISRIRMTLWVVLIIVIALMFIYGEEIGSWFMNELTSGKDSQLQQLLR
ncbi:MAG: hypothetical protein K5739_08165 [Lachnospiraceae bacterium]|nr:hypothetical protein [Lachnospiraceae bacterium]